MMSIDQWDKPTLRSCQKREVFRPGASSKYDGCDILVLACSSHTEAMKCLTLFVNASVLKRNNKGL
jgi:hypothetical protein